MKKFSLQKIHLGRAALVLLASALIFAGMLSCHGFVHYNGLVYRKRVAVFVLMVIISVAFAAFGKSETRRWKYSRLAYVFLGIVAGALAFQGISCCDHKTLIFLPSGFHFLLMIALSAVIYLVIWLLVWDSRKAVIVYYWLMCLLGYAYDCVYQFRGVRFKPADILSFGTALAVAGNYQYTLNATLLFSCMAGVLLWTLSGMVERKKLRSRTATLVKPLSLACAAAFLWPLITTDTLTAWGVETTSFNQYELFHYNARQGTIVTLALDCQQLMNIRPADYDPSSMLDVDQRLLQSGRTTENQKRPNVFVVMNESMADLGSWLKINTTGDPLSHWRTLSENALYGNLYVSAFGGSTCNSEHSFLTATPPAPTLNMPLLSTARNSTPSLPWLMRSEGYRAIAMHPNLPTNYQRNEIYPQLGFEKFLSVEDFEGADKVRTYIADIACYQKIIDLYEQKSPEDRLFVFNVTMQNHGHYRKGGIEKEILLTDGIINPELEEYLNLLAISDAALKDLIDYFEQQEEPCVILIFGDHQPIVDLSMFEQQDGLSNLEQQLTQYITPFMIWANYPIETGYVEAISINYLAPLLQKIAGLPMTAYDEWLLETAEKYPVVVLSGYADAQGNFFAWEEQSEWPEELTLMNHLRYNRLYDAENRLPALDFVE